MIYVIESGNYFKVGYTSQKEDTFDKTKRASVYNTHNPDWKLAYTMDEGNLELETYVHRSLKPYKHRGEWFNKFEGWKEYVIDLLRGTPSEIYMKYNPYGEVVFEEGRMLDVFNLGLSRMDLDLWMYIMCRYGFINNSGKLPSSIELNPATLEKSIFSKKRRQIIKSINKLMEADLIRPYGKKRHLYAASPIYINPNVYMFPKLYDKIESKTI